MLDPSIIMAAGGVAGALLLLRAVAESKSRSEQVLDKYRELLAEARSTQPAASSAEVRSTRKPG